MLLRKMTQRIMLNIVPTCRPLLIHCRDNDDHRFYKYDPGQSIRHRDHHFDHFRCRRCNTCSHNPARTGTTHDIMPGRGTFRNGSCRPQASQYAFRKVSRARRSRSFRAPVVPRRPKTCRGSGHADYPPSRRQNRQTLLCPLPMPNGNMWLKLWLRNPLSK